MKIGILTFHRAINYGAILQAYALQTILNEGHEVELINYEDEENKKRYSKLPINCVNPVSGLRNYITNQIQAANSKKFLFFRDNNLNQSMYISNKKDLKKYCDKYDAIIVGSDQVWNLDITNNDLSYFLDFASSTKKISYAASFGVRYIKKDMLDQVIELLRKFDAVSVRESTGCKLLSDYGIVAKRVFDPTLLLNAEEWRKIARRPSWLPQKYIAVYGFGVDEIMLQHAKDIAEKSESKVVLIGNFIKKPIKGISVKRVVSPEEWVYIFLNAESVVTNSFHGIAFSINFGKKFWAFNSKTNLTETNSRIEDILKLFELDCCDSAISSSNIYSLNRVNAILAEMREYSREFLRKAVGIKE